MHTMPASLLPTRDNLAAVHTVGELANLLHCIGFPIGGLVGHRTSSGIHIGSCPATNHTNTRNQTLVFDTDWDLTQPVPFAACCAALPTRNLINSLGYASRRTQLPETDRTHAAGAAIHSAIHAINHTTTRDDDLRQLARHADTISVRQYALEQHYPTIAAIVTDIIDVELAAETDWQNLTTIVIPQDSIRLFPSASRRTRLLAARSRLTFPGLVQVVLVDGVAVTDIEQQPGRADIRVAFRATTPAAAHSAAHALHVLLTDILHTPGPPRVGAELDNIAATVAALHPDITILGASRAAHH
jgi:hypothetical protein